MPSGRDIHSIAAFEKPMLGEEALARLRAPPERLEVDSNSESDSDDEDGNNAGLPGAFPSSLSQATEPYF